MSRICFAVNFANHLGERERHRRAKLWRLFGAPRKFLFGTPFLFLKRNGVEEKSFPNKRAPML